MTPLSLNPLSQHSRPMSTQRNNFHPHHVIEKSFKPRFSASADKDYAKESTRVYICKDGVCDEGSALISLKASPDIKSYSGSIQFSRRLASGGGTEYYRFVPQVPTGSTMNVSATKNNEDQFHAIKISFFGADGQKGEEIAEAFYKQISRSRT